jgi:ABC-type transport system involved in multi-copper enzyme maturation permease subunit
MQNIQTPSSLSSIGIIAKFELVRLFQTPRGLMSIAAFAIVWYFILKEAVHPGAQFVSMPFVKEPMTEVLPQLGLSNLLEWPVVEFVVFWLFALFLFPMFTVMITADQTSSDRSRGTLRFLTLRTSRDSIFFGRFIGQLIIQALLIIGVMTATLAMSVWNNADNFAPGLNSALIMGVNLLIVVLPFTAMMAFFSALVKSSRLAIILAIIACGATSGLVGYLIYKMPSLNFLTYIIPGNQLFELVQSNDWETLNHSLVPFAQAAVFLFLGRTVVARSSL